MPPPCPAPITSRCIWFDGPPGGVQGQHRRCTVGVRGDQQGTRGRGRLYRQPRQPHRGPRLARWRTGRRDRRSGEGAAGGKRHPHAGQGRGSGNRVTLIRLARHQHRSRYRVFSSHRLRQARLHDQSIGAFHRRNHVPELSWLSSTPRQRYRSHWP